MSASEAVLLRRGVLASKCYNRNFHCCARSQPEFLDEASRARLAIHGKMIDSLPTADAAVKVVVDSHVTP